jgi:hypothetical protein
MEARMEMFLLNVMGSAAVASAIVVGAMTNRLSKELAGLAHNCRNSYLEKPDRNLPRLP